VIEKPKMVVVQEPLGKEIFGFVCEFEREGMGRFWKR